MRTQLLGAGLFVALVGAVFYAFPLPLTFAWSLTLLVAGGLMCLASFFISESTGPVKPPAGFRFCAFCSTLAPTSSERCPQCNGIQPQEEKVGSQHGGAD